MKQCPKCLRSFPDNALNYCLDDGTPLGPASGSDTQKLDYWRDQTTQPDLPRSLSFNSFAYGRPDWLDDNQAISLEGIVKAAFTLLFFERTVSGCWSKTYLYRLAALGKDLPLAYGSLTGTPFALFAMSSCVEEHERLIANKLYAPLAHTLATIILDNGRYLRGHNIGATMGPSPDYEEPRHAAGGCLVSLLFGHSGPRHQATLRWLCGLDHEAVMAYDQAMIFRALAQASSLVAIPAALRQQAAEKSKTVLGSLIESATKERLARNTWSGSSYGYQTDPTNQWGCIFWILTALIVDEIPTGMRQQLESVLWQLLLTVSPAGDRSANNSDDAGDKLFGEMIALVGWRTLELHGSIDAAFDKDAAGKQEQVILECMIRSWQEMFETALKFDKTKPQAIKGYLIWGGLCLGAATVGTRLSADGWNEVSELVMELNALSSGSASNKLEEVYFESILQKASFSPENAKTIAQVAARIETLYRTAKSDGGSHPKGE